MGATLTRGRLWCFVIRQLARLHFSEFPSLDVSNWDRPQAVFFARFGGWKRSGFCIVFTLRRSMQVLLQLAHVVSCWCGTATRPTAASSSSESSLSCLNLWVRWGVCLVPRWGAPRFLVKTHMSSMSEIVRVWLGCSLSCGLQFELVGNSSPCNPQERITLSPPFYMCLLLNCLPCRL